MAEQQQQQQQEGEAVTQRVRQVSECQVMLDVVNTLQHCTAELQCAQIKLETADRGSCLVHNTRPRSLAELREEVEKCKRQVESLQVAFVNHMEQRHPVFGTPGRAAADSGYCGSQSGSAIISSQVISSVDIAMAELSPNSLEQPAALSLRTPIQEEGDQTQC